MVDGNYFGSVGDLIHSRADTVVLLDPPRHVVMQQVTWRTLRRLVTREQLWNGNRENLRNILSFNRDRSIILWAWYSHSHARAHFDSLRATATAGQDYHRLRDRGTAARFLDQLSLR